MWVELARGSPRSTENAAAVQAVKAQAAAREPTPDQQSEQFGAAVVAGNNFLMTA
jgi:hypothetical protein